MSRGRSKTTWAEDLTEAYNQVSKEEGKTQSAKTTYELNYAYYTARSQLQQDAKVALSEQVKQYVLASESVARSGTNSERQSAIAVQNAWYSQIPSNQQPAARALATAAYNLVTSDIARSNYTNLQSLYQTYTTAEANRLKAQRKLEDLQKRANSAARAESAARKLSEYRSCFRGCRAESLHLIVR